MPNLTLTRRGHAFYPANRASALEAERFPEGVRLGASMAQKRSRFHNLYWAFCTYVANALNAGPGDIAWTQEMVSDRLKLATGRAEVVNLPQALQRHYGVSKALKPSSIAFSKMDEAEFSDFAEAAISYVLTEFGPWVRDHPDWQHVREIAAHAKKGEAA